MCRGNRTKEGLAIRLYGAGVPRVAATVILLALSWPLGAHGAGPPEASAWEEAPGFPTWVRVDTPVRIKFVGQDAKTKSVDGLFRGQVGDSILLRRESDSKQVVVSRRTVLQLDVSWEDRPRTWRGAAIGAVLVAGLGVLIVNESAEAGNKSEEMVEGVVWGGLVGAWLGALVGSTRNSNRWYTVYLRGVTAPERAGTAMDSTRADRGRGQP